MTIAVSVCIPVFNRKHFVIDALRSALAQDIDRLEVIVIDNHSDDGTWEALQTIQDSRLRLCRNERNFGLFGNFSRAGEEASGEFVLFLCSDDTLRPGFLRYAIHQLRLHPRAAMLSSAGRLIDEKGSTIRFINQLVLPGLYEGSSARKAFFWYMGSYGINIFNYPSGILLRRSVLEKALPFRSEIGDPADVDMWLRCLEDGDLLISDFVGCDVTWHGNQLSSIGRKAGKHITEIANFARLQLPAETDLKALRRFRRLLGATSLAWAFRTARSGDIACALTIRRFGPGWLDILTATLQRALYVALARVGIVFRPCLRRLPDGQG